MNHHFRRHCLLLILFLPYLFVPPSMVAAEERSPLERALGSFLTHRATELRKTCGTQVAPEFWLWLEARPALRRGLMAGSHLYPCKPSVRAALYLDHLRRNCPGETDEFPSLALGFIASYSYHSKFSVWKEPNPKALEESFRYFVAHEKDMLFPIRTAPWPLLAHTASSERPVLERIEMLALYEDLKPVRADRLQWINGSYNIPLYKKGRHKAGAPHLAEREAGVAAMTAKGYERWSVPVIHYSWWGVCNHKSWYAYHVHQMFGIPAFRFSQRNHAWPGSVIYNEENKSYRFHMQHAYGRTTAPDEYGTRGESRKWNTPIDFGIMVRGINHDAAAFEEAILVAALMEELPPDQRGAQSGLIKAAVTANPWVPILRIQFSHLARKGEIEPKLMLEIARLMLAPQLHSTKWHSAYGPWHDARRITAAVKAGILHHAPDADAAARVGARVRGQLAAVAKTAEFPLHEQWRNLDGEWIAQHQGDAAAERHLLSALTRSTDPSEFNAQVDQLARIYRTRKDSTGLVMALKALQNHLSPYPEGVASEDDLPDAPKSIPWKTAKVPGTFKQQGFNIDGSVWYVTRVRLDSATSRRDLVLELGVIDDADVTYWNGKKIGSTAKSTARRRYSIPAADAEFGENILAVRVHDKRGVGGFTSTPDKLFLSTAKGGGKVELAGNWDYWIVRPDPGYSHVTRVLISELERQKRTGEAKILSQHLDSLGKTIRRDLEAEIEQGNLDDPAYRKWLEDFKKRSE